VLFECFRKVTLIEKAARQGDIAQRRVRLNKLFAGEFDSPLSYIVAYCAVIKSAELARKVNRMYVDKMRKLAHGKASVELFMEDVARLGEPAWSRLMRLDWQPATRFAHDLKRDPFHDQRREFISPAKLDIKSHRQTRNHSSRKISGFMQRERMLSDTVHPSVAYLNIETARFGMKVVSMRFVCGMKNHRRLFASARLFAEAFSIGAFENQTKIRLLV